MNAGLYLHAAGTGLLVDGLCSGGVMGCSDTPAAFEHALRAGEGAFGDLAGVAFTHLHPDHYDAHALEALLEARPGLVVLDEVGRTELEVGPMRIRTIPTKHDGEIFADVPHQMLLIGTGEEELLVAGDAYLDDAAAREVRSLLGGPLACVFANPYQLLEGQAVEALRLLAPERILVYHVPFASDDVYHYHEMCDDALARPRVSGLPQAESLAHMSWLDGTPRGGQEGERR